MSKLKLGIYIHPTNERNIVMKSLILILCLASLAACDHKEADKQAQFDVLTQPDPKPIPSAYAQGTVNAQDLKLNPDQKQTKK
ncbi:putative small lipoprotein YifL [Oxalobacteraceae bacterium GrIS 1.18]